MRPLRLALCGLVLTVGCAGPHSNGALWALQNIENEGALFRQTDAQRAAQAITFEQGMADSLLSAERSRLQAELTTCPGPTQPLGVSPGDTVRDAIRLHAQGEAARLTEVAHIALADWRLRRASATSSQQLCADAQNALMGDVPTVTSDILDRLPVATVTRDPRQTTTSTATESTDVLLSQYALGYVDAVQAAAPLPQYLALVYGGSFTSPGPTTDAETAARMVDAAAPAYPEWEPDALYAALRGATS